MPSKPIFIGTKFAGKVEDKTLKKKVKGSMHFIRTPSSIAFDVRVLKRAIELGATKILVTDSETGTKYTSIIKHFREKYFKIERGHGEQVAMILNDWKIEINETIGSPIMDEVLAREPLEVQPESQGSLFDTEKSRHHR